MRSWELTIEPLAKIEKNFKQKFCGVQGRGAAHPPYINVVPFHPKFYPRLYALGPRPLKKIPLAAGGIFN